MKLYEITAKDVINGKIWKVTNSDNDDWLFWELKEAEKINKSDIIQHSSVIVGKEKIYLSLVSKYYEDGGEIGEYTILINDKWKKLGVDEIKIEDNTEGPYLSRISTLDIHEYQKGSFDNRDEHISKFKHYIQQLNNKKFIPYPTPEIKLPKKILEMDSDNLINYLKEIFCEIDELQKIYEKVSKINKLYDRTNAVLSILKKDKNNYDKLKYLLLKESKSITRHLVYNLIDIFEKDCIKILKKISKKNNTDGLVAKEWLREHKANKKL